MLHEPDLTLNTCWFELTDRNELLYIQVETVHLVIIVSTQFRIKNALVTHSVQFSCSVVSDSLRPQESQHARPPCPSHLLEFTQTHVHRVGDAIQPSHPLSSPSTPAPVSQHQSLLNESALCVRWPNYWSFSFNISPSNEHPGLISFRMDWLDLLAVQGTLKSLLQHHS